MDGSQAEILVTHTELVLQQLDRAQAEIAASLQELTGTVRVAAFQTPMPALLARDIDLSITETFPGHGRPAQAGELSHHTLCEDPMRLAVRALPDLARHPWVMEPAARRPGGGP